MATSFGTTPLHGIAAQQTGWITESITDDYVQKDLSVPDVGGNTIGKTFYDESIQGTIEGWIPSTGAFTGTLASAISLTTAPADHLVGAVTGGSYLVMGLTRTYTAGQYRRMSAKYEYFPSVTP